MLKNASQIHVNNILFASQDNVPQLHTNVFMPFKIILCSKYILNVYQISIIK